MHSDIRQQQVTKRDNKNQEQQCNLNWKTLKQCSLFNYSCPGTCWEKGEWD